jgi:hypothetical protein
MNDGSKGAAKMRAGLALGDKPSHLCLIDTESDEVIEEGLLCVPPQTPYGTASIRTSRCASPLRWGLIRHGRALCSKSVTTKSIVDARPHSTSSITVKCAYRTIAIGGHKLWTPSYGGNLVYVFLWVSGLPPDRDEYPDKA